jgi:hypothetical protein
LPGCEAVGHYEENVFMRIAMIVVLLAGSGCGGQLHDPGVVEAQGVGGCNDPQGAPYPGAVAGGRDEWGGIAYYCVAEDGPGESAQPGFWSHRDRLCHYAYGHHVLTSSNYLFGVIPNGWDLYFLHGSDLPIYNCNRYADWDFILNGTDINGTDLHSCSTTAWQGSNELWSHQLPGKTFQPRGQEPNICDVGFHGGEYPVGPGTVSNCPGCDFSIPIQIRRGAGCTINGYARPARNGLCN